MYTNSVEVHSGTIEFWNEKKEKLKSVYPYLSDEDLEFHEGKESIMIERIAYKLGKSASEFCLVLDSLK